MKVISLINQKGGVGKTTSVINIAAGLNLLNKKTLAIDLDPQANLTYSLGIDPENLEYSMSDLLSGEVDINDAILDGICIPASLRLSAAEVEFSTVAGREFLLKEALEELDGYDYVIIDCPPSLGLLTLNALAASDEVYIPLQTEFLALQGMSQLIKTIDVVQKRLNEDLEISGIIATRYDSRKNLSKEVIEKIETYFGDKLFKTFIRDNVALAEAPSFGKDIFSYRASSSGATDYKRLCWEIVDREK